jgi:type IV pilus assembly protein PilM
MTRTSTEDRGRTARSPAWLAGDAPLAAVEIASDRVTAVGLSRGAGGPVVQGWATEALPGGAVVPSLTALNVADTGAVTEALRRALSRAGVRGRRAGLVIPDLAAKVSLVPFETVPAREDDLTQLITWQVRKAAPFRIEDAQMAFVPGAPHGETGRTFVVSVARRDVVRQYEDVCAAAGAHAGIVDLASFNVINAVLASEPAAGPRGDWLLVNTTRESQTLAIMRGDTLLFFRNRPIDGDQTLPDLVHQTAMYYEDRLQGAGFARVMLAGGAAWSGDGVRRGLSERLQAPVSSIEPRHVAAFAGAEFDDLQPAAADALLASLGLLLRERSGARPQG